TQTRWRVLIFNPDVHLNWHGSQLRGFPQCGEISLASRWNPQLRKGAFAPVHVLALHGTAVAHPPADCQQIGTSFRNWEVTCPPPMRQFQTGSNSFGPSTWNFQACT